MEKVSTHQFMILGTAVLMGTTFLPIASIVTGVAGRDGWMSVLPAFAAAVPYGLMVISLLGQYQHKNLLQISEILLGKWIGKIAGILYILISSYFGGLLLGQAGDMYQTSIMQLTPISMFYLGALLLIFFLVNSGIEVFARFSEIIFPVIVIALALNIGLSIPRIEQEELMPILSEGIKPLFWAGIKVLPFVMEYILFIGGLLAFLPTNRQEIAYLKKGVWRAVLVAGILDTLVVFMQIMVFGPGETVRLVYGLLVLGKMVEVSRTVAGVESLFLGVWLGALVIKVSAFFFTTTWGLETLFRLKGFKWNFMVSILFILIAFKYIRGPELVREIDMVDDYLILPFTALWIPTLWLVSRWKKEAGV